MIQEVSDIRIHEDVHVVGRSHSSRVSDRVSSGNSASSNPAVCPLQQSGQITSINTRDISFTVSNPFVDHSQ